MIKEMNLISVPTPLTDVLSSLSTGIIEAAYAPPLGILALQWNTKVKYLVNFPISYSTGAFLIHERAWNKIPEKYRSKVREISKKYISKVNNGNRTDNQDAMNAMEKSGVKFIEFSDSDIAKAKELRSNIIKRLVESGSLFSKDALTKFEKEFARK